MRRGLVIAVLVLAAAAAVFYGYQRFTSPERTGGPIDLTAPRDQAPEEGGTREVDLYFADSTGRRLALERREITGAGPEGLVRAAVEELVKGPSGENRVRTLPDTVQIRAVYRRGDVAWVDLGTSVVDEHPGGAWTELLTVYSIVNTITENFVDVEKVQILVEGKEKETLAGHVDISVPLESRVQLLAGEWD